MRRHGRHAVLLAGLIGILFASSSEAGYVVTTFDAPFGNRDFEFSRMGINDAGVVVGSYFDAQGGLHGFRRDPGGAFTNIDVPGAAQTLVNGISNTGEMTGYYNDGKGQNHGFIRSANGSITTFDVPASNNQTFAQDINDGGQVTGSFRINQDTGFIRGADGGFTAFSAPPIANFGFDSRTSATAINDLGQVAGTETASNAAGNSTTEGFIRNTDGTFATFQGPATLHVYGLNHAGQVSGYLTDVAGNGTRVFVRDANGTYNYISIPGTTSAYAFGINNHGQVVGFYGDSLGDHGFIANPPGSVQTNPILPSVATPGNFTFHDAPSGDWFDPPFAGGFHYAMTSGALFTRILDFPTGFLSPFTVSVDGRVIGSFGPGQGVDFTGFAGGGVSSFDISGINPVVDTANPAAFPLRLEFNTPTADFTMTASAPVVPEPPSFVLLSGMGVLGLFVRSWSGHWRTARSVGKMTDADR